MKLLVTGGAGFIGSAVIRHIVKNTTDEVVNLDKLTYAGNLENLADVTCSQRYRFEQADICDGPELDSVFRQHQPDVIIHLAAETHVDRSIEGPSAFIKTNIVGTYTLLEAARHYWQSMATNDRKRFRFVHVSTDEVYGDLRHPTANTEIEETRISSQTAKNLGAHLPLFTEHTAYAPSSPYSASKASSDHLVRAWHRTFGLPVVITNCSNNYGPYQFPEKLIPLMILNALEGKTLPIYGKGEQIRDWLYVEDHVRALYQVISKGRIGDTYNIGGHNEKQNIEVVHTICSLLDEMAPEKPKGLAHYRDLITHIKDRPGHDLRYAIDARKIQRDLGWKPDETFESGLRKTVRWYLANRLWCRRVQNNAYQHEPQGSSL